MLLTPSELDSLTRLIHRSPHTLLGLHPLGDGSGMVGRAMIPGAVAVQLVAVHDRSQAVLDLQRLNSQRCLRRNPTFRLAGVCL